jgi:tRNA G18 (ribose-2'-O)-methylase SpoU
MLMFNVQKQKNFGNLVRSAAAFNVSEVFIIDGGAAGKGKKKMRTFGSQGTHTKTNFRYFDGLKDVRSFCTT